MKINEKCINLKNKFQTFSNKQVKCSNIFQTISNINNCFKQTTNNVQTRAFVLNKCLKQALFIFFV
jgi:hypothetical protein